MSEGKIISGNGARACLKEFEARMDKAIKRCTDALLSMGLTKFDAEEAKGYIAEVQGLVKAKSVLDAIIEEGKQASENE